MLGHPNSTTRKKNEELKEMFPLELWELMENYPLPEDDYDEN